MSATAVAAAGIWVFARSSGRRLLLLWALVPLVAASAPLWSRVLRDVEATRIVQVADRDETAIAHLEAIAPRLHEPLGGVLGTHVPVVADSEDFVLHAPGWAAGLTVLLYGFLLVLAGRAASGRHASLLYLLAAGLAVLAFPLPVRSAPHTLRLLTPLYLPVAALVAWAAAPRGGSRRAWVAVLTLAVLHLALGTQLLSTWRRLDRAEAPFLLRTWGPRAARSRRPASATPMPPTAPPSASRGRARSASWSRRPGTSDSATGPSPCSTRCGSRRTWRGS